MVYYLFGIDIYRAENAVFIFLNTSETDFNNE